MTVADACELVRQAALGLQYASGKGLVHRDIKPSNLILARSEHSEPQVKILDFGLALLDDPNLAGQRDLTTAGQMMGTLDYMAPEQGSDSHEVDIRADIYSLGATLFKLLCGQAPLPTSKYNTLLKMLTALATEPAPSIATQRHDLPGDLVAIVDHMLAKDPADRFATPQDVAAALAPLAENADLAALLQKACALSDTVSSDESALTATGHLAKSGSHETEPTLEAPRPPISKEQVDEKKAGIKPSSATQTQSWLSKYGRRAILVTTALAGIILLSVILKLRTPQGTVTVKLGEGVSADDVQIEFTQGNQLQVIDKNNNWKIDLTDGKWNVSVKGGGEQFTIDKQTITVRRRGKVYVTVTLKDNTIGNSADREVAERLLRDDRVSSIKISGRIGWVSKVKDLRGDELNVVGIVCNSNEVMLQQIVKLTGLRELISNNGGVTDQGMATLSRMWDLESLQLKNTKVTDAGLKYLESLHRLDYLLLEGTDVSASGVARLQLIHLNCRIESGFSDEEIAVAAKEFDLDRRAAEYVLKKSGTVVCAAPRLNGFADIVDGKKLSDLPTTPFRLGSVVLGNVPEVHDDDLKPLEGLTNLTQVFLQNTEVGNEGLQSLARIPGLSNVSLFGTQVTDEGLVELAGLPKLRSIHLGGTALDQRGIEGLTILENTTKLSFGTITRERLLELAQLSHLRRLGLATRCVTSTDVEDFQKINPACRVFIGPELVGRDPVRDTAEWAQAIGATVLVLGSTGENVKYKLGEPLPAGPFDIRSLDFLGIDELTDDDLARLSVLPDIYSVGLASTKVTHRGIQHLLQCRSVGSVSLMRTKIKDEALLPLGKLDLYSLYLSVTEITSAGVAHLRAARRLETLELNATKIDGTALQYVAKLTFLTRLQVNHTQIGDEDLPNLYSLASLRNLGLRQTRVTVSGVAKLQAALPECKIDSDFTDEQIAAATEKIDPNRRAALWWLSCGGRVKVETTDKKTLHVTDPPKLPSNEFRVVGLETVGLGFHEIEDDDLRNLRGLEHLTSLSLNAQQITNDGLRNLTSLKNLEVLWLGNGTPVNDTGLKYLKELKKLSSLNLKSAPDVTETGVRHLKELRNLKHLHLHFSKFGDAGLEQLKDLTGLEILQLHVVQATNAGIAHLKEMTNLHTLQISGIGLGDAEMVHLEGMTNLRELNIRIGHFTDSGLEHLENLKGLNRLDLRDTAKVTAAGVAKLQAALPKCKIESDFTDKEIAAATENPDADGGEKQPN